MRGQYPLSIEELEDAWLTKFDEKDRELHEASMRIYKAEFEGAFYRPIANCSECYKND